MTYSFSKHWALACVVLCTLLVTPVGLSSDPLSAQDPATAEPDAEATSEPFEAAFGPGSFNLMSPTVGLSNLSSYRAILTLSFDGTTEGQPEQWARIYTMLVITPPPTRQLTIENPADTAAQVYIAEVNNILYERRGGDSCIANTIEIESTFAETWELAGFLDSVIGADEAGTEIVNGVAANHYTFDERAQGALDIAESTGDLWIAADGGYLVRYMLVTTGSADYFGEGVEGTLTWDYELNDVNQPLVIEIPDNCPGRTLDVPVLPDAIDLLELPGFTSYTTPSGLQDTIAFYQEQVAALGGQSTTPPTISEDTALFGFSLEAQPLLLIVSTSSGSTRVDIYRVDDPTNLAIAAEVPGAGAAETGTDTTTPSDACANTIPILPDATDVQTMPGLLAYMTSTSVADIVAFYQEQVVTLGGQVSLPLPASDVMAMLDVQMEGQSFSVTILSQGGITSVTITSTSGNLLIPGSDCT